MAGRDFKALVQSRDLKVGVFLAEFWTPGIGEILASAGIDFAFVDMEHTGFDYAALKQVLRFLHGAGVASLVRPASREYHDISRACDMGAQGLVPPMMTAADHERVAAYIKYPPHGVRGVAFQIAHDDYAPGPALDKMQAANRKTTFVALIETRQGLNDVEKIAAHDGVDALFIGHFDLSCSLGVPAQFDDPTFLAAIDRIRDAAKANGKSLGRVANTPEEGAAYYADGFDLVLYSGDVWLLQKVLADGVAHIRAGLR